MRRHGDTPSLRSPDLRQIVTRLRLQVTGIYNQSAFIAEDKDGSADAHACITTKAPTQLLFILQATPS